MLSFADVGITSNHEGGGDEQYSAAQHEAMCGDRKRRWRSLLVGVDDGRAAAHLFTQTNIGCMLRGREILETIQRNTGNKEK